MLNATDPVRHAELQADARDLVGEYADYAKSNELVQMLEGDTPFGVKLSIGSTMSASLKALQASLR